MVGHNRSTPVARSNDPDGFRLRYLLCSLAVIILFPIADELDRILRLYVLLIPVVGIPTAAYLIYMLAALVTAVVNLRWRRAISVLLAPVVAISSSLVLVRTGITPAYIRFEIGRSAYRAQVAALPSEAGYPKIKVWNWGQTGGVGVVNDLFTLVYDSSDEIALAPGARSPAWRRQADLAATGNGFYGFLHPEAFTSDVAGYLSGFSVVRITGHFYLVDQTF